MIKWVERGVLLAAILSMLFVWPYGGIREDKKDSSLSEDYGYTEPLQVGEYASQYFVAETDFLKTLEIAVNYNQEEERNGLLGLEIWKEDQKIYEGVIPYDAMEPVTFFPAVIETRLKKGALYEIPDRESKYFRESAAGSIYYYGKGACTGKSATGGT